MRLSHASPRNAGVATRATGATGTSPRRLAVSPSATSCAGDPFARRLPKLFMYDDHTLAYGLLASYFAARPTIGGSAWARSPALATVFPVLRLTAQSRRPPAVVGPGLGGKPAVAPSPGGTRMPCTMAVEAARDALCRRRSPGRDIRVDLRRRSTTGCMPASSSTHCTCPRLRDHGRRRLAPLRRVGSAASDARARHRP